MSFTPKFAFVLPTVKKKINCGGYLTSMEVAKALSKHAEVKCVSYGEKEEGVWYLPEVIDKLIADNYILVLLWGIDVNDHINQLYGTLPIVYYYQGVDFGVRLRPDIPIMTHGHFLMFHALEAFPGNPLFYFPRILEPIYQDFGKPRDIDVLIIKRKQPKYIVEDIPRLLEGKCKVHVETEFLSIPELVTLYNRSKVYVYAFDAQPSPYAANGWRTMEGFGNQPIEAAACGCSVLTDCRGGNGDFIEPWINAYHLRAHSPEWDVQQILHAISHYPNLEIEERKQFLKAQYGDDAFAKRAEAFIDFLRTYIPFSRTHEPQAHRLNFPSLQANESPMDSDEHPFIETLRLRCRRNYLRLLRRLKG